MSWPAYVAVSTSKPRSRASSSARPTDASSGSVKIDVGAERVVRRPASAEHVGDGDLGLVGRDRGQLDPRCDVTGGPDARRRGPHPFVDDDPRPRRLDTDAVERKSLHVRAPPRCDEQHLGLDDPLGCTVARTERGGDPSSTVASRDASDERVGDDLDPLRLERGMERCGRVPVRAAGDPARCLDDGHAGCRSGRTPARARARPPPRRGRAATQGARSARALRCGRSTARRRCRRRAGRRCATRSRRGSARRRAACSPTLTVFASSKLAAPSTAVNPRSTKRCRQASWVPTSQSFRAFSAASEKPSSPVWIPRSAPTSRRSWNNAAAVTSCFVGLQATLAQLPPQSPSSTTATRAPWSTCARVAASRPAPPPPTTIRSKSFTSLLLSRYVSRAAHGRCRPSGAARRAWPGRSRPQR